MVLKFKKDICEKGGGDEGRRENFSVSQLAEILIEEELRWDNFSVSQLVPCRIKSKDEIEEELRGGSTSGASSSSVILDDHEDDHHDGNKSPPNSKKKKQENQEHGHLISFKALALLEVASESLAEFNSLKLHNHVNNEPDQKTKKMKKCKREEKEEMTQLIQRHHPHQQLQLPRPELSEWVEVHRRMGGSDAVFLFEKVLTATDVHDGQCRLFMNTKATVDVLIPALTRKEEDLMMNPKKGLKVMAFDGQGKKYDLIVKHWSSVEQFVLISGWKMLVRANGLMQGNVIRIWYFHYGDERQLGFLINRV